MKTYSQNAEDLFVLNHFGYTFKGTLLEIGANDGVTLSNSRLLIEHGWKAHLVEPGTTFGLLPIDDPLVKTYNYAIGGEFSKSMTLHESGAHVIGGADIGLVSTLDFEETLRWRKSGVKFETREVDVKPFRDLYADMREHVLDFISIDAEGYDFDILQQIDLNAVGCKCLCIEWNGDYLLRNKIVEHCAGYTLALVNNENLIFVK